MLTDQQDRWGKGRSAVGGFTDDRAYIRDLIRHDQEQNVGFQALEAAIREGIDSGASDKTVPRIMEESKPGFAPMVAYRLTQKAADGIYESTITTFGLGRARDYLNGLQRSFGGLSERPAPRTRGRPARAEVETRLIHAVVQDIFEKKFRARVGFFIAAMFQGR